MLLIINVKKAMNNLQKQCRTKPPCLLLLLVAMNTIVSGLVPAVVVMRDPFGMRGPPPHHQQRPRTAGLQASTNNEDSEEKCWNPKLRGILGTVAAIGAVETAYLTSTKLSTTVPFCLSEGCSSVLDGPYAYLPGTGVPLSALGFLAYILVIYLAVSPIVTIPPRDDKTNRSYLTATTTGMAGFSTFLMVLLTGILNENCPYCVASAFLSILLAALSWLGGSLPNESARQGTVISAGVGLVSFLAPLVFFLSTESTSATLPAGVADVGGTQRLLATTGSGNIGQAPPAITATSSTRAIQLASTMQQLDTRFYGAFWCSHCYDQKQTLGKEAMDLIPYIECSKDGLNSQTELCKERKVPGYPTWEINGRLYPGERGLEELEEIVANLKK